MVLKAKRVTKKEAKAIEDYKKDMAAVLEEKQLNDQKDEFLTWLTDNITAANKKGKTVDFLVDMKKRLMSDRTLTENMVAALRKWQEREKQWAEEKKQPKKEYTITLKVSAFIMKKLGVESRVITGTVKAETGKAWLIEGTADMVEGSWCMRCSKELTQAASFTIGYGEICAAKMGVPYPSALNSMTAKQKAAYRKKILKTLHNQKFEAWIPKSKAEILEGAGK